MRNLIWKAIARLVVCHRMALIDRAMRTPYTHIHGEDGTVYMRRFWLFNAYPANDLERKQRGWLRRVLPAVRVHHIMRPDQDRHMHDHPWNARTIVLHGWYCEERPTDADDEYAVLGNYAYLREGDTGRLLFGQFHRIDDISLGGVWTLFITWKYRGTWGFSVNGRKVPWKTYLGVDE